MPKRDDIHKILLIGSGPIVIGQACEFDYSGTQACKALKEEGFQVVLVNSNPATIMTDPGVADRTYIEPLSPRIIERIIKKEKPDALLPTLGGQTSLNVSVALAEAGVLERYGVEMLGADHTVIKQAEDRNSFKKLMEHIGLEVPKSGYAKNVEEARGIAEEIGSYPLIIRPSFTLGGTGGGIVYNVEEYGQMAAKGMECSPLHEILVEESLIGWKEFELEVMRDKKDNVVVVCSIENFDPMGIHTGDSITVAPAQTLTDREYQDMRNAAKMIIRGVGVETGGSNIQFAVHPKSGRMVVIEMNPRVSRSSALASKATGFPIAKIAAKLAVGYTLDEIPNDITKKTPASFEPTIDYCVVKIPRWAFEKFPEADPTLTIQMKSVGEAMAIGRTFKEALQKASRSLETGRFGITLSDTVTDREEIQRNLRIPNVDRVFFITAALRDGMSVEEISKLSSIDPWFLENINELVVFEQELETYFKASAGETDKTALRSLLKRAKEYGFSDVRLSRLAGMDETAFRRLRKQLGIEPVYKLVDTCAAEFEAYTPYYYSTYERESEVKRSARKKIMILGGGPNRIGQGIEFDYCCVHASFALKEEGFETIMVNSNPETVSTDYDTSDKLYFEPITVEDVLNIYEAEACDGAIVQFGGQTPLNLANKLEAAGVNIIGTSPDNIARAEDRDRFREILGTLGLVQTENDVAVDVAGSLAAAQRIGYPVVVRPSFVLGGRAMEIVYDGVSMEKYMRSAVEASPEHPVLIEKFLEDAVEVDVDAISDGRHVVVGAIMEHIEEAGIHSGDSACAIPPYSLSDEAIQQIKEITYKLAREIEVHGLMNVQYAIKNDVIYVLEVNPRASRTIPFVSKAIGVPLAKLAAKVMVGKTLKELGFESEISIDHFCVKEAVLPFARFPGVDIILGPEMKSTGEVMGIDKTFGKAFAKTQFDDKSELPTDGTIFISVKNRDKRSIVFIAKKLHDLGFQIVSTSGTAKVLRNNGIEVRQVYKLAEGRPNVLDLIKNNEISIIINTPTGKGPRKDEAEIRSTATMHGILCVTTISGASALTNGLQAIIEEEIEVAPLQEFHKKLRVRV